MCVCVLVGGVQPETEIAVTWNHRHTHAEAFQMKRDEMKSKAETESSSWCPGAPGRSVVCRFPPWRYEGSLFWLFLILSHHRSTEHPNSLWETAPALHQGLLKAKAQMFKPELSKHACQSENSNIWWIPQPSNTCSRSGSRPSPFLPKRTSASPS